MYIKTKIKPKNKYGRWCTYREVFNSKVKTYNQTLWELPISCYICLGLFYATNFFYLEIVLSEITAMVENSVIVSIFMPKDFQNMYQEKTKDLRIPYSTEKNVNVTGSKEALVTKFQVGLNKSVDNICYWNFEWVPVMKYLNHQ